MPLRQLPIQPGIRRDSSRYAAEGNWYDGDKIRFRNNLPEKIGGWRRVSSNTFLGVCRGLFNWVTLGGQDLMAVGTHLRYYIERSGEYFDVTPIDRTSQLTDPLATTSGSSTVVVTASSHGARTGDAVEIANADDVGGITVDGVYAITRIDSNSYSIDAGEEATSTASGGGTADFDYLVPSGAASATPLVGYGAGPYGAGPYGEGGTSTVAARIWSQGNFGEDLIFAFRGSKLFYWVAEDGVMTRAVALEDMAGANSVPAEVNIVHVSDISRFVITFGAQPFAGGNLDPMLIRWSDQEDALEWQPQATNQSGELRLSQGSRIVAAQQARQEILVWTDSAMYSFQYLGGGDAWGAQLVASNTSIVSQNAVAYVNGVAFWMGKNRFYRYDGVVTPMECPVHRYVFSDLCVEQYETIFAGTNESDHEIWWFYCSLGQGTTNRYVVYNYVDNLWYFGTMERSAWLDAYTRDKPHAATYSGNLVRHEVGVDDGEGPTLAPINAYITSAELDIDEGDRFMFIRRVIPDVNFSNSSASEPEITMRLLPLNAPGSGYTSPASEGSTNEFDITRSVEVPVQEFTPQAFVRVRARQLAIQIESGQLGVAWQLGNPRYDMRPDGRR